MGRRTSQYSLHFSMVCLTFFVLNSTFYTLNSTFYMANTTFCMVNQSLFIWSTRLFIWPIDHFSYGQHDFFLWSTFEYSVMTTTVHCAQTQTKAASSEDEQAVQQISSACAIAKQALEAIGNLQSNDNRNLAALTATNSSSTSSSPSSSSGSIAAELARRFPSYNARGVTSSRKRPSTSNSSSSLARGKKNGRPSKTIVHKDLVVIPNPNTNQVPSHVNKVKLEVRGFTCKLFTRCLLTKTGLT